MYFCSVKEEQQIDASGFLKPLEYKASDSFVILEELPSRGFNSLYRAKRGGRLYILKGLKEEHRADPMYMALLQKEYELTVGLDHPCIVRFYSMEEVEGVGPCIVMEHIEGETLDRWLESNPSAAQRRTVARFLLDAMQYYHSCGVIHRDLKPRNIFVTSLLTGEKRKVGLKIIDFGLADSSVYADFKEPAGTEGYAAPEQWNGDAVDARADIYSFGILLCQLFPHRYGAVARRCSANDPARRYASAYAVAKALRNSLIWHVGMVAVLFFVGIVCFVWHSNPSPDDILKAIDTYRLRAELISRQAEAAFVPDSLSCEEEAQQQLAIYTVRYLSAVYEVIADHPEWGEIEHSAFEDEVSEIMTPHINRIGEQIRSMRLSSNPTFFQAERFRTLADRFAVLEDHHLSLRTTYGAHNPK